MVAERRFGTYKCRLKIAMDRSMNFGADYWDRQKYHMLAIGPTGAPRHSIDVEQAHLLSVQIWRQLPASFFAGAWVACGYVSLEDMAKMTGQCADAVRAAPSQHHVVNAFLWYRAGNQKIMN